MKYLFFCVDLVENSFRSPAPRVLRSQLCGVSTKFPVTLGTRLEEEMDHLISALPEDRRHVYLESILGKAQVFLCLPAQIYVAAKDLYSLAVCGPVRGWYQRQRSLHSALSQSR